MDNILLSCPFLGDLSLVNCYGLYELNCKYPNVKKLVLCLASGYLLHVSYPHVTSLEIRGWIGLATLLDVSSVMDASISYTQLLNDRPRRYAWHGCTRARTQRLLQEISLFKTLTLSGHTIVMLTVWDIDNAPCLSYQWKNLTIKLELTRWHHPGLCWLLKSCPALETLTMYIDHDDVSSRSRKLSHWFYWLPSDQHWENYLDLQEARFPCLKCITIHCGCINEPSVDQVLKFLLRSCTKLQKMVIYIKETFKASSAERQKDEHCSSQVLKFRQELSTYPRASSQALICFPC